MNAFYSDSSFELFAADVHFQMSVLKAIFGDNDKQQKRRVQEQARGSCQDKVHYKTLLKAQTIVSLNSDVWCQNFKCRIDFGTLYTENLKQETLGIWSILFKNVLQRQKHFQNVEKSKYAKRNLTLTFSISNVVFKVPNVRSFIRQLLRREL